MKYIIQFLFCSAIVYAFFAISAWDWHMGHWWMIGRILYCIVVLFLGASIADDYADQSVADKIDKSLKKRMKELKHNNN